MSHKCKWILSGLVFTIIALGSWVQWGAWPNQSHLPMPVFAKPDVIQWSPGLPKTRSGKIMRRILRKIAACEFDDLGDTSTLAEPTVVAELVEGRHKN